MKLLAEIGFDGNAPEFIPIRDITGKGKRGQIDGIVNVRVDRLEWLLSRQMIDTVQHSAGRRLQGDTERATLVSYASLEGRSGGSGTNRLSDVKCDAIARRNAAQGHVGASGWRILDLVVLENANLAQAEARMGLPAGGARGALTVALDSLARFYRMA